MSEQRSNENSGEHQKIILKMEYQTKKQRENGRKLYGNTALNYCPKGKWILEG